MADPLGGAGGFVAQVLFADPLAARGLAAVSHAEELVDQFKTGFFDVDFDRRQGQFQRARRRRV